MGLILLILLARRKPQEPNALSSSGLTSRRTTSKIQKTNNFSPPTKRWQRFSAVTASVPSVWPNFFHPTSLDKLVTYTRKDLYEPALSSPIIKTTQKFYTARLKFYTKESTEVIIYCKPSMLLFDICFFHAQIVLKKLHNF